MDEHIAVAGAVSHLDGDIADINLNNIGWWTDKHNRYASREAVDELCRIAVAHAAPTGGLGGQARARRWLKRNVYGRTPLGLRALLYFTWRYVFRLGFLDGWPGLAFHVMQGLWYRFLVDVKVHEIRTRMRTERRSLAGVVEAEYGLKL